MLGTSSTYARTLFSGLSSGFDAKGTFIVAYTYTGQVYAWGKPIGHSPQAVSGSGTNNNFGAGPNKNFGAGPNSIFGAVPNVNFGAGVTLPFSAPISISTSPFVSNSSGSAKQPSPIISKPTQPPPIISKPTLVSFPSATEISEVACGTSHCLALSKDGKVGDTLVINIYILFPRESNLIKFIREFDEKYLLFRCIAGDPTTLDSWAIIRK